MCVCMCVFVCVCVSWENSEEIGEPIEQKTDKMEQRFPCTD